MRSLVVYETVFGATGLVAEAIAHGLSAFGDTDLLEAGAAMRHALPKDVRLLVIGGPAYTFGMSRPINRRRRARWSTVEAAARRIGIREWIGSRGPGLAGLGVATFETRPAYARPTGSAARAAARALRYYGADIVAPPATFLTSGITGRLADGELARAQTWADWLAKDVPAFAIPLRARS